MQEGVYLLKIVNGRECWITLTISQVPSLKCERSSCGCWSAELDVWCRAESVLVRRLSFCSVYSTRYKKCFGEEIK